MTGLQFDPDNTLSGGLYAMTPKEAVALAAALCEAVEQRVGADGCHGGVWPGNITAADGQVALGEPNRANISEMSSDQMEFVSPEQFWNGIGSPASDVYSIGLILYTALNRGVMPWFNSAGDHKPEERATALQNRMKGKALDYPATAGRALGDVVLKALSFHAEDRYANPGLLKAALAGLPESAGIPAAVPPVHLSEEELRNAPNYRVDKEFESAPPEKEKRPKAKKPNRKEGEVDEDMDVKEFRSSHPPKKSAWRVIIPLLLIAVIIAAAILLMRGCVNEDTPFVVETETPSPVIHEPVPETDIPGVTPTPTPTPEPTPTPTPEPSHEPGLELVMADVSWTHARELCEERGGHLATVRNADELQQIIAMAEEAGARFVWLGAYRGDSGNWYYVTGDAMEYAAWDTNEPSAFDTDGTKEDYLLLWYRPKVNRWSYNDMRNDPVSLLPATYGGKTAFICQYD